MFQEMSDYTEFVKKNKKYPKNSCTDNFYFFIDDWVSTIIIYTSSFQIL